MPRTQDGEEEPSRIEACGIWLAACCVNTPGRIADGCHEFWSCLQPVRSCCAATPGTIVNGCTQFGRWLQSCVEAGEETLLESTEVSPQA